MPSTGGELVQLPAGERVSIRPIRAADRDGLRRGFERLGSDSRYRRFMSPIGELTSEQLSYLTEVDHHDHEALIATDARDEGVVVGVARWVRSPENRAAAEVAVTVVDDWQGRGLGRTLLERLTERAREEGIERFTAEVLAENRPMIDLLGQINTTRTMGSDGEQLHLELDLPDRGRSAASLFGALRHAAAGRIAGLRGGLSKGA